MRTLTIMTTLKTDQAKHRYNYIMNLAETLHDDPKKDERLKAQECKVCFYTTKVAGNRVTSTTCTLCETQLTHATTSCDALCIVCAKENNLCKHCAGDIDMKQRRNKRPHEE